MYKWEYDACRPQAPRHRHLQPPEVRIDEELFYTDKESCRTRPVVGEGESYGTGNSSTSFGVAEVAGRIEVPVCLPLILITSSIGLRYYLSLLVGVNS
jgi:hypothetical protein